MAQSKNNNGGIGMTTKGAILQAMTPNELTQIIFQQKELFILDVRNQSDYENWKIEGHHIESINIPYFDLIDGVEAALSLLPEGKKVLVVCAKEGSSIFVAEQLVEAGRNDVSYLQGGMKSWSDHLEPVKVGELHDGGALYQFVRVGKGCLSYMVVSHADHISGGKKLADQLGATYWIPAKDATEVTFSYEKLEEGREIRVGDIQIKIQPIYSPGHTIGSTSIIVDDQYLLTGDILFVESIGRPDLAGKAEDWVGDLRNTLYNRYKELSDELMVLPAHFGKYTELGVGGKVSARLGDLYQKNPGLNIQDESEFRKAVTENLPPQPNAYQEIRQTNMGKINPSEEEQREMEMGPNRCAVHDK
jgi:glyoxylase-like metal-dependent hydrolase (beta-lactamase superfamily II)/rhodanese-related sulfurtransferase